MALTRSRRAGGLQAGTPTVVLAVVAVGATAAATVVEYGRVWRRGSAPLPTETEEPLRAAAEAAVETAEVAREGYRGGSNRENALFNLFGSFVLTFVIARSIAWSLRARPSFGPFRNVKVGRRHIHHFVPGIVLAFASGGVGIVTRNQDLERWLAVPFGAGVGLTLDESALLLELDDVYWSEEGILSVQITLAVAALLATSALAARFLRRGEQAVLDAVPVGPAR